MIAGLSGLVLSGLILGIGPAIAAVVWLIAWRLRKRRACRTSPHGTEPEQTPR